MSKEFLSLGARFRGGGGENTTVSVLGEGRSRFRRPFYNMERPDGDHGHKRELLPKIKQVRLGGEILPGEIFQKKLGEKRREATFHRKDNGSMEIEETDGSTGGAFSKGQHKGPRRGKGRDDKSFSQREKKGRERTR